MVTVTLCCVKVKEKKNSYMIEKTEKEKKEDWHEERENLDLRNVTI
jgi:hypothetical protein